MERLPCKIVEPDPDRTTQEFLVYDGELWRRLTLPEPYCVEVLRDGSARLLEHVDGSVFALLWYHTPEEADLGTPVYV